MTIQNFQIQVSSETLDDLQYRLNHIRWPETLPENGWEQGIETAYLQSLMSYWSEQFDWRKQEAQLNRFSQFHCRIDGSDIHFVHERGRGPNPIPLILTHGWPDNFIRYQKIIPMLTDPARYGGDPNDSFDVIIPSIPGFGFSSLPEDGRMNNDIVSGLWVKLMTEKLGYSKFAASGGDIGSGVTRYLAFRHPELLLGIHLTDIGIIRGLLTASDTELSAEEIQYKKEANQWISQEGGYMAIQSTKPATLAYGLSDSPAGLAAWIIEKFRAWSDCNGDLDQSYSKDELLTNIMLYWVTNTIGTSTRMYYENSHSLPQLGRIEVPTGITLFPGDILLPPKKWASQNLNIVHWNTVPRGGHFTAMEEPELFCQDIRDFFRSFRNNSL